MASAGFEPANLGTKGQHASPRPPKAIIYVIPQLKYNYVTDMMTHVHTALFIQRQQIITLSLAHLSWDTVYIYPHPAQNKTLLKKKK